MLEHLKKLDRANANLFSDIGQWAAVVLSSVLVTIALFLSI